MVSSSEGLDNDLNFSSSEDDDGDIVPPNWFDPHKIEIAGKFYKKFLMSIYMSCLCGLLFLLAVPSIAATLFFTGKSSSPSKSFKRYRRTIELMELWYEGRIWDVNDDAHKSLQILRKIHLAVKKQQMRILGRKQQKPFSQFDMVVTQFAFVGPMLLYPDKLGISCGEDDWEALIHFWKCIGYLLGIEEENNLCSGTHQETREKCEKIVRDVIIPALLDPPFTFPEMSANLLEAIKMIIPLVDSEAYMAFSFELLDAKYSKSLSWYSSFIWWLQKFTSQTLLFIPFLRRVCNSLMANALKKSSKLYDLLVKAE